MAHKTCVFTVLFAGTQEMLDAQMLLDPLEEQLDLPPYIEATKDQRRLRRVVGQEAQRHGSCGEECAGLVQGLEEFEIQISAIHHAEGIGRPDTPVARFVGNGQGGSLDMQAEAHRAELGRGGRQADGDVARSFTPIQLGEGHGAKWFGAGLYVDPGIALVPLHVARKAGPRNELHHLGKQVRADIHACTSGG